MAFASSEISTDHCHTVAEPPAVPDLECLVYTPRQRADIDGINSGRMRAKTLKEGPPSIELSSSTPMFERLLANGVLLLSVTGNGGGSIGRRGLNVEVERVRPARRRPSTLK